MYIKLRKVFVHTSLNHPVLCKYVSKNEYDRFKIYFTKKVQIFLKIIISNAISR